VAIIGPGPIGLLSTMLAKLAGAGYVVVIGVPADAVRLKVARHIRAETALGALDGLVRVLGPQDCSSC
jgi:threonine dehydrogenase-like Zn-dependent dehydrogenase